MKEARASRRREHTWAEVKVLEDCGKDLLVGDGAGAVCVHVDGQGQRHTDGIRHLKDPITNVSPSSPWCTVTDWLCSFW